LIYTFSIKKAEYTPLSRAATTYLFKGGKDAILSLKAREFGACCCHTAAGRCSGVGTGGRDVTTIGTPTFEATDFNLFAAPIGTAADGYAEFLQTLQSSCRRLIMC
jgi:hypothetical protein